MQKVIAFSILFFTLAFSLSFTPPKKEKIKWLDLKELQTEYAKHPKPILIDVYTSWCGWCKVMDKETYSNEKVAAYINKNFYAVKFDAESADTVVLASKKYAYNPGYNSNDLAVYLLGGRMAYPTTVLLSAINAQPAPIPGYMKPSELEPPLKYYGEGSYKKLDFPVFMNGFKGSW